MNFSREKLFSFLNICVDLSVVFLICSSCLVYYYSGVLDLREPLTKKQVERAFRCLMPSEYEIKRISLYQGGYAGNIGYYFIEVNPPGIYIIVANDKRYSINFPHNMFDLDLMLFDYISRSSRITGGSSLGYRFNSTRLLNFKSLFTNILKIKSKSQVFWEYFE
jgi:hypothetical protein